MARIETEVSVGLREGVEAFAVAKELHMLINDWAGKYAAGRCDVVVRVTNEDNRHG